MPYIIEPLPSDAHQASLVLHVRAHCRRAVDPCGGAHDAHQLAEALALLFGVDSAMFAKLDALALPSQRDRLALAADEIARTTGVHAVPLGHDDAYVRRCVAWLAQRVRAEPAFDSAFATDSETLLVFSEAIELAAASTPSRNTPPAILISGETGTGKELLARAIHNMSVARRAISNDRFVPVHVAGLSPDFANDDLFGHAKGAFTGAITQRDGLIHAADGGTMLIDEVGDLSREAQLRLLRVVQDGHVTRTGQNTGQTVAVRILAATNRDLDQAVRKKSFRLDLLHRLRQGSLTLPPLRARKGWPGSVVDSILRRHGQKTEPLIVRSARDALACHDWPGNLRELDAVLELSVARAAGVPIRVEHLPRQIQGKYLASPVARRATGDLCDDIDPAAPDRQLLACRVESIGQRISDSVESAVSSDPHVASMLAFHEQIPDRNPGHAETITQLRRLRDLCLARDQQTAALQVWAAIASSDLPLAIAEAVAVELSRLSHVIDAKSAEVTSAELEIDISKDAWWRLATDLAGLPIFDAESKTSVLQFIVGVMKVLASVSPEFADHVAERVRAMGLAGLRAALMEFMRTANHETPDSFDVESADKAQWIRWRDRFPVKRRFVEACERDAKTVMFYAKKACGGEDPWVETPLRDRRAAGKKSQT